MPDEADSADDNPARGGVCWNPVVKIVSCCVAHLHNHMKNLLNQADGLWHSSCKTDFGCAAGRNPDRAGAVLMEETTSKQGSL
jgi:hypothetical protein